MLKSLKDIPYPKLRQLARKRIKECKLNISNWNTPLAFDWERTPEGIDFWHAINCGAYYNAKKLYPELFTFPPRTKKQVLAWSSGSVIGSIGMAAANLSRVQIQNYDIFSKAMNIISAADVSPRSLIKRRDLQIILSNLSDANRELQEVLHKIYSYSGRLHRAAKEVLENDKK